MADIVVAEASMKKAWFPKPIADRAIVAANGDGTVDPDGGDDGDGPQDAHASRPMLIRIIDRGSVLGM